ncbi:MAG TPA: WecB/TagA/CpsF family glycosyltransferase [Bacillota bacterium]|jgi:N-acetylglucosaminyldiphosphoundecaprenol N-acetyl-beta-D-mannosaminyltransferase
MTEGRDKARDRVDILGVFIDRVDLDGAAALVRGMVEEHRAARDVAGCDAAGREPGGRMIVTPNAEVIYSARQDPALAHILNRADLAVADGSGVVLASRILGRPLPERVAGYDLLLKLFTTGAEAGWRVFLFGTYPETVAEAARRLPGDYPGLIVAGFHDGYFGPADEAGIIEQIRGSRADLLVTALGAPKQERWLAAHLGETGVGVGIGVGGSLDVLAGRARRAPPTFRRLHVEWLYRLVREPKRARRILGSLPRFAWAVLAERGRPRSPARP